jgi:hypothetical protein
MARIASCALPSVRLEPRALNHSRPENQVRALGVLLSELIERCDKPSGGKEQQALEGLEELQRACMHEETEKRPAAHEVVNAISALTASLHGG